MNNKYEILENESITFEDRTLYRIRSLKDFLDVKKGDIGGFVEGCNNLSQLGNCWIYNDAKVYGYSRVIDNGRVMNNAIVYGNSTVSNNAIVKDNVELRDMITVSDNAMVSGHVRVLNVSSVRGEAVVTDNAIIRNHSIVCDNCRIKDNAIIEDFSIVRDAARVKDNAIIKGMLIENNMIIPANSIITKPTDVLYIKNNWGSRRGVTYIHPTKLYATGCFVGTAQELLEKAKKDVQFNTRDSKYENYYRFINFVSSLYDE